jgi:galactose mutarotase-like enzyme
MLLLLLLQVGNDAAKRPLSLAAAVTEPGSGLMLKVHTNAPGLHFYTGKHSSTRMHSLFVKDKHCLHMTITQMHLVCTSTWVSTAGSRHITADILESRSLP